jgi:ABC-type transport system substrate-binding protein
MTQRFSLPRITFVRTSALLSALAAALLCTPAVQAETLRWARSTDASTLDPHALNNGPNHNLLHQVYEPLIIRTADGKLLPTLATSWALTSDPSVWEFKLRKGVKFHDGSLFTADDVLFSLRRSARGSGALALRRCVRVLRRGFEPRVREPDRSAGSPGLPGFPRRRAHYNVQCHILAK